MCQLITHNLKIFSMINKVWKCIFITFYITIRHFTFFFFAIKPNLFNLHMSFFLPAPKPIGRRSRKPGLDRKPRQAYSAKQLERLESEFKVGSNFQVIYQRIF